MKIDKVIEINKLTLLVYYTAGKCWKYAIAGANGSYESESIYYTAEARLLTLPLIIEKKFLHFLRAIREAIPSGIAELSHPLWERFCQAFPQHRNWVNVLGVNFHKINTPH
jgi:hypothetical protein